MILALESTDKIIVSLPSGNKATLPLHNIVLQKWMGKSPDFDYGKKPFVDYEGKPVFAELAILKLFIDSGWKGVWVETYGGTHFLKDMPNDWKLSKNSIPIPKDKEALLKSIWEAGKTTACFDVFVWKNNNILFCEGKHKGKDKLTKPQTKFIEGALSCGIPEKSLMIVEWEYKK
jgi:hypothetical protein